MPNTRSNKRKKQDRSIPRPNPTQPAEQVPPTGPTQPVEQNNIVGQNPRTQGAPNRDEAGLNSQARTQEASNGANRSIEPSQQGVPTTERYVLPSWPTSKPGPMAIQPPPGMRSINALRPEQVTEVGYNQETGTPIERNPARYYPDPSMEENTSYDQNGAERGQTSK